jgi:hypothetical protein
MLYRVNLLHAGSVPRVWIAVSFRQLETLGVWQECRVKRRPVLITVLLY